MNGDVWIDGVQWIRVLDGATPFDALPDIIDPFATHALDELRRQLADDHVVRRHTSPAAA
jgi:hypothetical protein